ncbi:IspD/TarI family cytidylyltransferase [Sneathiella glossodoripedis]|uniref:IspD/TarI family cytidylyltransferase n=1 Tax=Sneathiella glossodoripedis TaxID=418853 RepID=UPI000472EAA5|nr:2-C-methyl-D-erythritol 4-phosphate cytidylyltransferase [Sneathiella glossodoripedis]
MQADQDLAIILLAAGQGVRLGGQRKLDLRINGVRYLDHIVTLLSRFSPHIVVAISNSDLEILTDEQRALHCTYVVGGETRQASFEQAMAAIPRDVQTVLLHEVARPLVSEELISRILAAVKDHDVVVSTVSIPVRDSVALQAEQEIGEILPRDKLVLLQTPQAFKLPVLQAMMHKAREQGWVENSHVALAKKAGVNVFPVPGELSNIKVTYPEDIETVNRIASERLNNERKLHGGQ